LAAQVERGHWMRASLTGEALGLPEEELKSLRAKAVCQMAAVYRNAHGAKSLAEQYGYSREEIKEILEEFASKIKSDGNGKALEPCYDYSTGAYMSLEEWMDHYLKIWDRL